MSNECLGKLDLLRYSIASLEQQKEELQDFLLRLIILGCILQEKQTDISKTNPINSMLKLKLLLIRRDFGYSRM